MSPAVVLFLDFDGVLHSLDSRTGELFACRPLLEEVLREFPEVRIVISSSWREIHPLEDLRSRFSDDIRARIVGTTPILPFRDDVPHRQRECLAWLRANAPDAPWLAIDDVAALFEADDERILLCESDVGFCPELVPDLRARLARLVAQARRQR